MINNLISNQINDNHLRLVDNNNFFKKKIISCEVCNSKSFRLFQNIGRVGIAGDYGLLKIVICINCSFKFSNPRYVDEFYLKYYKKNYRKIAFGNYKPSKFYVQNQIVRGDAILNHFKKKINFGYMLDHGCASGATMIPWRSAGWSTFGIDPHIPSVEFGKKKYKLNIKVNFGEKLDFKSNFFDVVMSLGSLEHSYDVNKTLKEIKRVLKLNGHMIIRWRSDKMIGSPLEYYNHNHYRFFTRKTLEKLLVKYNMKIISTTKKPLEGYKSYQYTLVKNVKTINKKIKNSKTDVKEHLDSHKKYLNKYLNLCIKIDKIRNNKNIIGKLENKIIINNKVNLLAIPKKEALKRFFFETKKFLELVKKYNLIDEN